MNTVNPSDFYTIPEAAKLKKLDRKTVWRQVRDGTVPAVQIGKMHLIAHRDLELIKVRPAHGVKKTATCGAVL